MIGSRVYNVCWQAVGRLVKSVRPLYILVVSVALSAEQICSNPRQSCLHLQTVSNRLQVTAAVQGVVWVLVLTVAAWLNWTVAVAATATTASDFLLAVFKVTLYAMGILTTRLIGHKMIFDAEYAAGLQTSAAEVLSHADVINIWFASRGMATAPNLQKCHSHQAFVHFMIWTLLRMQDVDEALILPFKTAGDSEPIPPRVFCSRWLVFSECQGSRQHVHTLSCHERCSIRFRVGCPGQCFGCPELHFVSRNGWISGCVCLQKMQKWQSIQRMSIS